MLASACRRGGDDDSSPEPTDTGPTPTAGVNAVSDFALVGVIDEAFTGPEPDIDIPLDLGDDLDDPATTPGPSPVGGTPAHGGVIRLVLDDTSDDLTEACGLDANDTAFVYWTTNTFFEPATVLDDIEDDIEGRASGITGTIFRSPDDGDTDIATPEATTASPLATASPESTATAAPVFGNDDCVLIAEQVAFTTRLPTPRPRATAAPATPRRTSTPTATKTPKPTEEPDPTVDPTEEPEPSVDPTEDPEPT